MNEPFHCPCGAVVTHGDLGRMFREHGHCTGNGPDEVDA